jgi:hypothetical protein
MHPSAHARTHTHTHTTHTHTHTTHTHTQTHTYTHTQTPFVSASWVCLLVPIQTNSVSLHIKNIFNLFVALSPIANGIHLGAWSVCILGVNQNSSYLSFRDHLV